MNEKTTKNLNECQKAYRQALKENIALLHKIERALLDAPAAANGNWGLVGDMNHIKEHLQEVSDFMRSEGEYAK